MNIQPQHEPMHLWVAFGTPNTPPTRLEVVPCPICRALVPVVLAGVHRDWHDDNDLDDSGVTR